MRPKYSFIIRVRDIHLVTEPSPSLAVVTKRVHKELEQLQDRGVLTIETVKKLLESWNEQRLQLEERKKYQQEQAFLDTLEKTRLTKINTSTPYYRTHAYQYAQRRKKLQQKKAQ